MKTFITAASVLALLMCTPSFAQPAAQTAAQPAAQTVPQPATQTAAQATAQPAASAGEPNVKFTVIDDDSTHIDELKVRGHTQRITVKPKIAGLRGFEIITGDGSRDLSDGANTSRGATGKRVWNVLAF